ncbi:MAG: allophanate hydrolase [Proteobacteria bacterium]|nr:allophanate hydrolase [Pseudomonadota bacterium]
MERVRQRIAEQRERSRAHADCNVWIRPLEESELEPYLDGLERSGPEGRGLFGRSFAIKDNIDLAGVPTTAGCPEYAYLPERHATVVERLIAAGAIPLGKTNLDQFATGLVGVRSPYGAVPNAIAPDRIAGGSSSGSAVAVALGLADFALGTDTAGSGRVPAAFNELVGVKPTRGWLSTRGVVPACRTLDCVSIFARSVGEAWSALEAAAGHDPLDAHARPYRATGFSPQEPVVGHADPGELDFFGDAAYAAAYEAALERVSEAGVDLRVIDVRPFLSAAELLYEGPWIAERYAALGEFLRANPRDVHPVTLEILSAGAGVSAAEAFRAQYRLAELKLEADAVLEGVDCAVLPTAGTLPTLAAVAAEPVALNARLGRYTNFMNLLDLAAVAVPAARARDGRPSGVTLFGPAGSDFSLLALAARLTGEEAPAGAPPGFVELAVCGAHMRGMPLNGQLTGAGAFLLQRTRTARGYRLYALPDGPPERPALVRDAESEAAIELEVWAAPESSVGPFLEGVPAPLGLGKLELADGRWVTGFIAEPRARDGARDITDFGGWRAYRAGRTG